MENKKDNVIKIPGKDNNKNENNEDNNIKLRRIYLELHKTDMYVMTIDVPVQEDHRKENKMAIEMAWGIINGLLKDKDEKGNLVDIDTERFRTGDGFVNKILKRELLEE